MKIRLACVCHMGRVRHGNEDNFYFAGESLDEVNTGLDAVLCYTALPEREAETFAPNDLISQTMVATIMARLAKVDLSGDSGDVANTGVEPDQWYTTAAVWAWRAGIVGDGTYAPLPPLTRGDLAVMLVRYLNYLGISDTAPDETATFADDSAMTAEQLAAFQRLYSIGVLKGVGGNYMAPQRSTTRAEMAIITQRLSDYLADR